MKSLKTGLLMVIPSTVLVLVTLALSFGMQPLLADPGGGGPPIADPGSGGLHLVIGTGGQHFIHPGSGGERITNYGSGGVHCTLTALEVPTCGVEISSAAIVCPPTLEKVIGITTSASARTVNHRTLTTESPPATSSPVRTHIVAGNNDPPATQLSHSYTVQTTDVIRPDALVGFRSPMEARNADMRLGSQHIALGTGGPH